MLYWERGADYGTNATMVCYEIYPSDPAPVERGRVFLARVPDWQPGDPICRYFMAEVAGRWVRFGQVAARFRFVEQPDLEGLFGGCSHAAPSRPLPDRGHG